MSNQIMVYMGGGQHIHGKKGNLNPHLDYSIHPKTNLQRRINLIYYLTDKYSSNEGGQLGFWGNDNSKKPGKLIKEYEPKFNRVIIFNTSQNSWHGLSKLYNPTKGKYRKSLASYYISKPVKSCLKNYRAKFAPRANQVNDTNVLKTISMRLNKKYFYKAYRK